jgi:hypothetical protein
MGWKGRCTVKILVYEGCEFMQKALSMILPSHDVTVVSQIVARDDSDALFGIDAFSNQEIAIDPNQFDLAFVDRQIDDKNVETLQLVTALTNAGLACIGTSVIPACNIRIGTVAKGTVAKGLLITALRSGFACPEDFVSFNSDLADRLALFQKEVAHPTSQNMVDLHEDTEKFIRSLM